MQRNPNQQSGGRRWQGDDDRGNRFRNRDQDEGRFSSAEDERDYGSYTETDEGDSSVRAGSYDQGRVQYGRERDPGSGGRYAGYGNFGQGDYGYGYGGGRQGDRPGYGQSNYGQGTFGQSRRNFSDQNFDTGGQHRQSSPGGFGHAQGSSAWRGHGVEGDYGNFSSGGWSEPYGEGQQYTSRGDYGGSGYSGGRDFGGQGAAYRGQGSEYRGQGSPWGRSSQSGGGLGQHRGKGPKGYQRSDDRLKEMICERLRDDPHIDASDVTVTVQNSRVMLDGTVDSRHTKNLIEDVAEQLGVDDVQNNLRVQRQGQEQGRSDNPQGRTGAMGTGAAGGGKGATGESPEGEQSKQRRN